LLKQFPKIVDTSSDDQQATQAVCHGMEVPEVLDEKDIQDRDDGVEQKNK
jgi:hypothetical protein